jgi:putative membrane protein
MVAVAMHLLIAGLCLLFAPWAGAHPVDGSVPRFEWHASLESWVLACLAVSLALYVVGMARLWGHAGRGRGLRPHQAGAFLLGWLMLVLALVSPLDGLGAWLFSAHMVQHELLMAVVAPLMVMSRPLAVWIWACPPSWRRPIGAVFQRPAWRRPWRWLTSPLGAWLLHAAVLWLWHIPRCFEAALASNTIHTWQHLSFLASALLFWWAVLGRASRSSRAVALVLLFTTMLHTGALGALLTLSPVPWYGSYVPTTAAFGWDALEDQQLGGLVMWLPAGLAYFVAGLALGLHLLRGRAPAACGLQVEAGNAPSGA